MCSTGQSIRLQGHASVALRRLRMSHSLCAFIEVRCKIGSAALLEPRCHGAHLPRASRAHLPWTGKRSASPLEWQNVLLSNLFNKISLENDIVLACRALKTLVCFQSV